MCCGSSWIADEFPVYVVLAEAFGEEGYGMVVERVFKGLGHGRVVPSLTGTYPRSMKSPSWRYGRLRAVLTIMSRAFSSSMPPIPLRDRVHDDGDGMIAYHHASVSEAHTLRDEGTRPFCSPNSSSERAYAPGPFRVDDCIEGMCGAVCVPGREGGIVGSIRLPCGFFRPGRDRSRRRRNIRWAR